MVADLLLVGQNNRDNSLSNRGYQNLFKPQWE